MQLRALQLPTTPLLRLYVDIRIRILAVENSKQNVIIEYHIIVLNTDKYNTNYIHIKLLIFLVLKSPVPQVL